MVTDNPDIVRVPARIVAEEQERTAETELKLSSGVVVRCRRVSPLLLQQAGAAIPEPKVPTFFNENRQQEEENPAHPDYAAALNQRQQDVGNASINAAILMGTEIVEPLPAGFPAQDDETWISKLAVLGVHPPIDTPYERYISWMRNLVLASNDDLRVVMRACSGDILVQEEDVAKAAASFRSPAARRADSEVADEAGRQDGDPVHGAAAGGSPADRGV